MRVLITGGYGCIGSWVVRNLLDRGNAFWIYDIKQDLRRLQLVLEEDELPRVPFIAGDVTDLAGLHRAIADKGVTHVLHLAGLQVPTCRADPILGAKVNVLGTLAVFEAVKAARDQVQGLVYASSSAVFAPPDYYRSHKHPLPDDARSQPGTHYGYFKCCNEGNARIYFQDHGMPSVGLRPGTVYGVGRDFGMTSEPTKAIKSVAMGRKWTISYGGEQGFQFADDVAKICIRCLETPQTGAKVYNIRGQVDTVANFVNHLCEAAPEARSLIALGDKRLTISYDLDDAALQRDLSPLPNTSLAQGIKETLDRFRRLGAAGRLNADDLA